MTHHHCHRFLPTLLLGVVASCSTIPPANHGTAALGPSGFSHELIDQVQQRFVDARGRVDYAALQADPEALDGYYDLIAAHTPDTDPLLFPDDDSRLAFWINAYNTAVMKTVITHYPITSVSDVRPPPLLSLLSEQSGFFYFQRLIFGGETLNLYDLEHKVIRGRFADPRIHFAINCASLGCPKLPSEAFQPEQLQQQLERETRRFLNEERNLRVDDVAQTVHLSSILSWYEEDFLSWYLGEFPADTDPTLLDYARLYATGDRLAAIERAQAVNYEIIIEPYDWRLNDQTADY
ncbi:MAG: DUF547 domain-containing protein [Gemmatimonadetes bacterium]|jgi:hypothetical protein|nr:DUF547 domain-containing protein [Gemmatimonadota bacterium]MBT5141527.1 DUF547 domain-containing protein [Gemmatimonadota bacterium]MBT5588791.1 DUF547 domain-containing protein [Gemmatimonadota bacterium]MBT5965106.1 DUF547 domain-containing protein [Gemmatimonadota bacterium]MBT7456378.1 DUF547 domain-containing protein [Gemmatimonadota bacterium]